MACNRRTILQVRMGNFGNGVANTDQRPLVSVTRGGHAAIATCARIHGNMDDPLVQSDFAAVLGGCNVTAIACVVTEDV